MVYVLFSWLLLLYCSTVTSECPKYEEWQNKTVSPGGALVCALFYGDAQCAGFPLPFGINASSADLGSDSSPLINFYANNITALVRPGCKMYLWEGTNFTGIRKNSFAYKWNIEPLKYRSASCDCTIDDPDLLKCDVREQWELRKFCDFRESDIGGPCSFNMGHSYITSESSKKKKSVTKNITVTETMADILAEKMVESLGESRMNTFLDSTSRDSTTHTIFVDPRSAISVEQRSYVCGKYHLFTPEIVRKIEVGILRDQWVYNPRYHCRYWFSSDTVTSPRYEVTEPPQYQYPYPDTESSPYRYPTKPPLYPSRMSYQSNNTDGDNKCKELGGTLAELSKDKYYSMREWFTGFMVGSMWLVKDSNSSYTVFEVKSDSYELRELSYKTDYYNSREYNYICEKH